MRKLSVSTVRKSSAASTDPLPKMLITRQRKAETTVNQTPLRLIAIGESPQAEDDASAGPITEPELVAIEESFPAGNDGGANPVTMMAEHDAITRRVPDSASIAARESLPEKPKRLPRWKTLLPTAAVAVGSVGIVVLGALATRESGRPAPAPASTTSTLVRGAKESSQLQPSVAPPAPAAVSPSERPPVRETIRIEITAEPKEAELSLDGNVLAGHRLSLEVPRDRGIHVVSASAARYIPFNQQVSFSSDVVLSISLHRAQTPPARQAARPRSFQRESRAQSSARSAAVQSHSGVEPGMNLNDPSMRRHAKPIDERNPYEP